MNKIAIIIAFLSSTAFAQSGGVFHGDPAKKLAIDKAVSTATQGPAPCSGPVGTDGVCQSVACYPFVWSDDGT